MATRSEEGAARGLFGRGVRAALGCWPALQIAVENGFGGACSQEKAEWMVGAVEQFFQSNAELEPEEVDSFLAEVMNNEFDTMIEDGSLRQCRQGNAAAVHEAIARLAQKQQEARAAATKALAAEGSSSEEEQETEEEAMECSMNGPQPSPPPVSGPDDEDGWTLVRKKRK
ncbi:pre-rRNA-processing protein TSR2 homolog isoform X2 [Eublepharis macularius]|uniref:Pre-rRNA-processing protein TSR2 homolog n=1 Tax=Eublepharis macularius TaxID=481883 RepID=A0AA97KQA0_EUBMA|nr:pre-rRNA-processing protein TSR2 homolog isoform X2 [Eublepharis macularius]